jgi:hypothetical protein
MHRDSVQPPADLVRRPDDSSLGDQNQERCLKGIIRCMGVALENAAASGQNHRAMPANEFGEGFIVPMSSERRDQLAIAAPSEATARVRGAKSQKPGAQIDSHQNP